MRVLSHALNRKHGKTLKCHGDKKAQPIHTDKRAETIFARNIMLPMAIGTHLHWCTCMWHTTTQPKATLIASKTLKIMDKFELPVEFVKIDGMTFRTGVTAESLAAVQNFQPDSSDILLTSYPKSGMGCLTRLHFNGCSKNVDKQGRLSESKLHAWPSWSPHAVISSNICHKVQHWGAAILDHEGSHIGQLPKQGTWELSIGVQKGTALSTVTIGAAPPLHLWQ